MATGYNKWLKKPLEPSIEWTEHGLRKITRRWDINAQAADPDKINSECFLPRATPDPEFANALLVDQGLGDGTAFGVEQAYVRVYQELPADNSTKVQVGEDVVSYGPTGLKVVSQEFIVRSGYTLEGTVGTTTGDAGEIDGLILETNRFANRGKTGAVISRQWVKPGILSTNKEFGRDGLLYVTFESQGTKVRPTAKNPAYALDDEEILVFQGGPEADLFKSRTRNVKGYRRFIVTVMMLSNGDVLDGVNDNVVNSYQKYEPYSRPGLLTISVANGPVGYPSTAGQVKVQVTEYLSKDSTIAAALKPYTITHWASYSARWTPEETLVPKQVSKGARGYLADSDGAGSGPDFWGVPVDGYSYGATSNPTPAAFNAAADKVIGSDNGPAFVTDEGVKWYRKVKVQVVGTFQDNLGAL